MEKTNHDNAVHTRDGQGHINEGRVTSGEVEDFDQRPLGAPDEVDLEDETAQREVDISIRALLPLLRATATSQKPIHACQRCEQRGWSYSLEP